MFASARRQSAPRETQALARLRAACELSTPVAMMAAHMALSCSGHLRSASPAGVVVDVPHPPRDPLLGALVALSFPAGGKAAGFTSAITDIEEHEDGSLSVTLSLPDRIQLGQQRASVRVPVPPGTVSAAILHGESLEPVVAIDISLHGILIEFPEGHVPDIEEGHRRMVALKLEGKSVLLEAEVRRRDGPRYGMYFIIRGERPTALTSILSKLQFSWGKV